MGKGQKYQEQRDKGNGVKLTGLNVNQTRMEGTMSVRLERQ